MNATKKQTNNIIADLTDAEPMDDSCAFTLDVKLNQYYDCSQPDPAPTAEQRVKPKNGDNNETVYTPSGVGMADSTPWPADENLPSGQQLVDARDNNSSELEQHGPNSSAERQTQRETSEQFTQSTHTEEEIDITLSAHISGLSEGFGALFKNAVAGALDYFD